MPQDCRFSPQARSAVSRRALLSVFGLCLCGATMSANLAACGTSWRAEEKKVLQTATPTATYTIVMGHHFAFDPHELTIPVGSFVTWHNTGNVGHTITTDRVKALHGVEVALPPGVQPWDSGMIGPGGRWTYQFSVPGTYRYFCLPHQTDQVGRMVGTVRVFD